MSGREEWTEFVKRRSDFQPNCSKCGLRKTGIDGRGRYYCKPCSSKRSIKYAKEVKGRLDIGTPECNRRISETTKAAMMRPEVNEKLHKKRIPTSDARRAIYSDRNLGRPPKNIMSVLSSNHGWLEIGGKKYYMKSTWERNYARYLEWLKSQKQIFDWEYEPTVFVFHAVQFGNRTYKPDFKVIENDGTYSWHEVKGFMYRDGAVKLRRMARYYPQETIKLIQKKEYVSIMKSVGALLAGLEMGQTEKRYAKPIL